MKFPYVTGRAPAPKKDQIFGSEKNPKGSAEGPDGDIKLDKGTEKALVTKADEHNARMKKEGKPDWTRVRVGALRSVWRRGAGAFSTSHRPGMTRAQWAMARVNAFLYLAEKGRPKNPKYVTDNDLLDSGHPKFTGKRTSSLPCVKSPEHRADAYSPTAGMKEEAQKGLDWKAEFGRGGTEVGVARARDIINGKNLPIETVRRMHSFFSRHEVDKKGQGFSPGEDGFPSAGRIAWALWGGDPGQSWARKIVEAERAAPATGRIAHSILGKESEDTMTDTITHEPVENEEESPREGVFGMMEEDDYGDEKEMEMKAVSWVAVNADEKRDIAYTNLELRAEGGSNKLFGYAAVFDSPSEPMPFREYVRRGAFAKTLKDGADVRLLVDHSGIPLARTKSGTLKLWEDEVGLAMETELDEKNPLAATVISAMRRGDMTQMSFAFRTIKDSWDEGGMVRELREVQLYDVSVVTYPAYEATMVQLRAAQESVTIPQSAPILLRKNQVRLARLGKPRHSHQ